MTTLCMGKHTYDPESGWCVRCGCVRADGKVTTPGGRVLMIGARPTTTSPEVLAGLGVAE